METLDSFSSQITFLNCREYAAANRFMTGVLNLTPVYDIGWAKVYAISGGAFLGVVDHSRSALSSGAQDRVLISLTTRQIEQWYDRISPLLGDAVSPIREVADAGLESFFFTGPEGYCFEIQQFLLPEGQNLF